LHLVGFLSHFTICLFLFIKSNIFSLKTSILAALSSLSFWMIWILFGWKCKSNCIIRLTLLSDSPSFLEWSTADRRGLCSNNALTASMFCGVRTVLTPPPPQLSRFLQSCLPTSLWHELMALYCFDESRIYCEIHVGRQRSYRSYKMNLRRNTLCTSPRLHFKLNAIHGHATW